MKLKKSRKYINNTDFKTISLYNILHGFLWYRVVSVTNHKLTFIIVTNCLCSVYLSVPTTCLCILFCHHDKSQKHHRLISSLILFGSHRIVITTYHHLMPCRDCQESIASARCQDSITVILFHHPLFLYRITLFECQLVTRDVQY